MAEATLMRRVSGKGFYGTYFLCAAGGAALAVLLFFIGQGWFSPLGFVPVIIAAVRSKMIQMGSTYRLFPDRLEVESGIVSRKIENIELFRIRDIGLRQGLIGRLTDVGDVFVHSTDASTPTLHVKGIDQPREFYQQLRDQVSSSRAQGRTLIVEQEAPLIGEG